MNFRVRMFVKSAVSGFDENVFEAILPIHRYFNLTKYNEVIIKKNSLLIMHAGMQI